jgi:hypothetical protein
VTLLGDKLRNKSWKAECVLVLTWVGGYYYFIPSGSRDKIY